MSATAKREDDCCPKCGRITSIVYGPAEVPDGSQDSYHCNSCGTDWPTEWSMAANGISADSGGSTKTPSRLSCLPVNHVEAIEFAAAQAHVSNLARCYLQVRKLLALAEKIEVGEDYEVIGDALAKFRLALSEAKLD